MPPASVIEALMVVQRVLLAAVPVQLILLVEMMTEPILLWVVIVAASTEAGFVNSAAEAGAFKTKLVAQVEKS